MSDVQPGIDCGTTCNAAFDAGSQVTLTATPDPGSRFVGWSGDPACSGTGPCTLTMDQNHFLTATFTLVPVLSVMKAGSGAGTVTSNPAGIDCGTTCSAGFDQGTVVTLSACRLRAAGSWSGRATPPAPVPAPAR